MPATEVGRVMIERGRGMLMARVITVVFDGDVLRPAEPLDLERNTSYRVIIDDEPPAEPSSPEPDVLDDLLEFSVETGIADLAEHHDHYLYGTPKR